MSDNESVAEIKISAGFEIMMARLRETAVEQEATALHYLKIQNYDKAQLHLGIAEGFKGAIKSLEEM